jgi:hypothetical protein
LTPFGQAVSEEKIFLTLANQKQELPLAAIFVGGMGRKFRQQIWPPRAILVSDWLMLKKSSPLKLLGQMESNLAGSIYVRFKPGIDGPWVCKGIPEYPPLCEWGYNYRLIHGLFHIALVISSRP